MHACAALQNIAQVNAHSEFHAILSNFIFLVNEVLSFHSTRDSVDRTGKQRKHSITPDLDDFALIFGTEVLK